MAGGGCYAEGGSWWSEEKKKGEDGDGHFGKKKLKMDEK